MIDTPEIDQKAVARRMRTLMQMRDKTIVSLARAMGVSATLVEELVVGRSTIGPTMAEMIGKSLRCSIDYLLTGKVRP